METVIDVTCCIKCCGFVLQEILLLIFLFVQAISSALYSTKHERCSHTGRSMSNPIRLFRSRFLHLIDSPNVMVEKLLGCMDALQQMSYYNSTHLYHYILLYLKCFASNIYIFLSMIEEILYPCSVVMFI